MYRGYSVAVVIPSHNEADFIAGTLNSIPAFVDSIYVVDDGSCDSTIAVIDAINSARIRLIRHEINRGVGAATVSGYGAALREGCDIIAVMDGDGQMHADDLPALLDALVAGEYGYVKGNRFQHASIKKMPWLRYCGNTIFSALMKTALGLTARVDAQCGYSAISRAALAALDLTNLYPRYGFLNELLFRLREAGVKIGSVPVRTIYGREISGINPFITVPIILSLIARGYLRRVYQNLNRRETAAVLTRNAE